MDRWEYDVQTADRDLDSDYRKGQLNLLGSIGWELCGVTNGPSGVDVALIFKRRIDPGTEDNDA